MTWRNLGIPRSVCVHLRGKPSLDVRSKPSSRGVLDRKSPFLGPAKERGSVYPDDAQHIRCAHSLVETRESLVFWECWGDRGGTWRLSRGAGRAKRKRELGGEARSLDGFRAAREEPCQLRGHRSRLRLRTGWRSLHRHQGRSRRSNWRRVCPNRHREFPRSAGADAFRCSSTMKHVSRSR